MLYFSGATSPEYHHHYNLHIENHGDKSPAFDLAHMVHDKAKKPKYASCSFVDYFTSKKCLKKSVSRIVTKW